MLRHPLLGLGVKPRVESLDILSSRADVAKCAGKARDERRGRSTAVMLEVGEMSRRDADLRRERPQGKARRRPEALEFET